MTFGDLYLLDTNMVSYFVSGRSPAVRRTYKQSERLGQIAVSVMTQAEILFGMRKKPEATRLLVLFEEFFNTIPVLPWDSDAARAYATLRAGLSREGKSLSVMDLLIASHAIAVGATLVSHDRAFLQLGSSLNVVDWATDL